MHDPFFWLVAVPAVLIVGISKGGFGGGIGMVGVPLMSLAISPNMAAAIMLPILCVMDLFGVYAWRGKWHRTNMRILIGAAMLGIALGAATFRWMDADMIRMVIGLVAVGFALNWWFRRDDGNAPPRPPSLARGGFWGSIAGFTSFVAHAGGPPVAVYLLPQRLDKSVYQATTVIFFIAVNYIKLIPYTALGQFSPQVLWTALILAPLAPLGVWLGWKLHHRVSGPLFYQVAYGFLFLTGLKLIWDGAAALMG
ncbi:sulfite exporter TauE/SafE family protein [Telmatospirillum sp. J64-1]|uniref:sulfite exporter TauE/SafE family protein n=1 Tax=Telmatospirillum sp. J64-1 TaxID=2502183 RepID=UPI00115EEB29|nr:sulfite exporter TauE/SafE family protein [Telmatospirillum sp. J64-1]